MRWDYKLVSYSLLIYFTYGILNLLDLNDFVVPLPLSFIFTIIISIVFSFKTKLSIYTSIFTGIPLLILKDLFIYNYEWTGIIFIILSLISWMVLGLLLIKYAEKNSYILTTGVLLIFAPILLINSLILSLGYLTILLLISFYILQKGFLRTNIPLERSLLMLSFIITLFLINEASVFLVSQ